MINGIKFNFGNQMMTKLDFYNFIFFNQAYNTTIYCTVDNIKG